MLVQEVGFDVVSMWAQMGYLARGLLILIALSVVLLAAALVSKLLR
jgi:hypothetical protein